MMGMKDGDGNGSVRFGLVQSDRVVTGTIAALQCKPVPTFACSD